MVFNLDKLKQRIIDDKFKEQNSRIEPAKPTFFERVCYRHCGKPMAKAVEHVCGVDRDIFYCQKCGEHTYNAPYFFD